MKTISGLGFPHIETCFSLSDQDVFAAVGARETTKALLDHLARIAAPNAGAPKILLVFAKMATPSCDWLDGELRVELLGDGDLSVIEVTTELGAGLRERALPSFTVPVPLSEFVRAVERVPHMIDPLIVKTKSERRLALVARAEHAGHSLPPTPIAIAEEHLVDLPRSPQVAKITTKRPSKLPSKPPKVPSSPPKPPSSSPPKAPPRPAPKVAPRPAPKVPPRPAPKPPPRPAPKLPKP